jgi:hypothetical protein
MKLLSMKFSLLIYFLLLKKHTFSVPGTACDDVTTWNFTIYDWSSSKIISKEWVRHVARNDATCIENFRWNVSRSGKPRREQGGIILKLMSDECEFDWAASVQVLKASLWLHSKGILHRTSFCSQPWIVLSSALQTIVLGKCVGFNTAL